MSDQNPSQQEPQPETVAYYEQQGQEQQSREHQQPLQQVPEQQPQPQAAAPATPAAPALQETCPICNEPVLRIHHKVKHGGHTYHSKCFVCSLCGEKLAGKPFFTEKEKRICKDCYASKVAPKCAQCGEAVTGEQVKTSDGKIYHPQCFRCFRCNKVIPGSYRTDRKTGKPEHAYNCIEDDPTGDDNAAAEPAAAPAQPGQSGAQDQGTSGGEQARKASAGGANRCRDCGKDLVNCKYFILDDGMKVCDKCFKHNHCATCRKCGKAIMSGQSHTVKDWKFHKECFNCPVCGTYMGDKPLKIQNGYVCLDSCDPSQLPPGGGQQNGQ